MTEYLTVADVLQVHARFDAQGVRDFGLIDSAVMRPQSSAFGEDACPTLAEKAAAMTESLARNHGFVEGNKRTALFSLVQFILINGYDLIVEPGEQVSAMVDIAEGRMSLPKIREWVDYAFEEHTDASL